MDRSGFVFIMGPAVGDVLKWSFGVVWLQSWLWWCIEKWGEGMRGVPLWSLVLRCWRCGAGLAVVLGGFVGVRVMVLVIKCCGGC